MIRLAGTLPALTLAISSVATAAGPAVRPDFTGVWLPDESRAQPWPAKLPLAPAARTFMEKFNAASDDPTSFCMPFGTPRNVLQTQFPLQVLQMPQKLVMVLQPDLANAEVRRVLFDGSPLPKEPDPSWFGTSRGRWEGSTLVIETIGLREDSLVSGIGIPHSDKLRVVERLSLMEDPRGKVLVDDIELHDASAYLEPLRTRRYFVSSPQASLSEGSCVERKWIDKLWHDRLQEHADAARVKAGAK